MRHSSPSDGTGLADLACDLERRLVGSSPGPELKPELASEIPEADSYVVVLFDGLGVAQLDHPDAHPLKIAARGTLHAPFPTTTSVSLATLATGQGPEVHGLISHLMWVEELNQVVNTLKWVDLTGKPVPHDYAGFLPGPNLWERLRRGGVEPITVQPSAFGASPLSRLLYRGARFEGTWDDRDLVDATVQLAGEPGRLIFTYFWLVDFAGHVSGLESEEFSDAMSQASRIWEDLSSRLPPGVGLIGTADHGLIEYREEDKLVVRDKRFDQLRFAGDSRGVHVWGDQSLIDDFVAVTGGDEVDPIDLYGPGVTETARARVGDSLVLAPAGKVILPPGFDKRLRCYHGGLDTAEVEVPLLVG